VSLPTFSRLDRSIACPASAALPQAVDTGSAAATRGTAAHEYLAVVVGCDAGPALDQVPAELRAWCGEIELERIDIEPGDHREWAVAYDVETGAAREIGHRVEREYGPVADTEIVGSMDRARVNADRVYVWDYKTGRTPVATPSWQLRAGAVAVATLAGIDTATVAHTFIREDGGVWTVSADLDIFDLEAARDALRALPARLAEARAMVAAGTPPPVVEGPHCRYCPAARSCPAKIGMVVKVVREPLDLRDQITELTETDAAAAVRLYHRAREALADYGRLVHAVAAASPIDMGDGVMFGSCAGRTTEKLDGEIALDVLREHFGEDAAFAGTRPAATKKSIEAAARVVVEAAKAASGDAKPPTLKATKEAILSAVRAAGGATTRKSTKIDFYKETE